jgi:hypothetical protein
MIRPKPVLTIIILVTAFLLSFNAFAQEEFRLNLSEPILESFPQVKLFLQVQDSEGLPVTDLPPSAFTLLEDNQPAPDLQVDQVQVGTRLVFALNTSPAFRIRDTLGRSRFELVSTALFDWLALPAYAPLNIDDFSLITAEGKLVEHSRVSAEVASTLANLEPTFEVDPGFELLFRALDLTTDPAPINGMPSSIFFITPLLRPSLDIPLETIIARAQASGTAIYPILVGPPEILEQAEIETFQLIADGTGGSLLRFDPDIGLGELANFMIAQRQQYQLTYRSPATSSGSHEIRATLNLDALELQSPVRSYVLELLAPEVTVLNMPSLIRRGTNDPALPLESITPTSQEVEFAVQFPDGYPRTILQSQLRVNNELVSEKLSPPFSPMLWDISSLFENEDLVLQISVRDSLGLQGSSPPSPVTIEVDLPPRGLAAIRPALSSLLLALGILLGGIALAAYLLAAGRRTEPAMNTEPTPTRRPTPVSRLRQERPEEEVEAYLYPLEGQPDSPGTIYLTGVEINIGRDPTFASMPIEDPSVEGLHARIIRQADGSYHLRDQGSKAGTWIMYQPIPETGQKLTHGDIVHFGRSAYRFVYVEAPPPRPVRILREGEEQQSEEEDV